jgi:hypothetical protein
MKIRSVLLGSAAIAGLTTAGYAADLGVVTSLDICDQLGLSGLTISSDDNCLQISGNISFEYDYGNYSGTQSLYGPGFARTGFATTVTVMDDTGLLDSTVDIDWWLKFVATSSTDFGPATATLKLVQNNWNGSTTGSISVKEAWVGVGDTTMLMAGYKGSIFNNGDDTPLNLLGLFNSSNVSTGVGFFHGVGTGGASIQIVHNLGNGLSIGGGLENLQTSSAPIWTAVGVLNYTGDGTTAHISVAMDQASFWNLHAGFTGSFDTVKVVGALAADSTGWWNVLGSAQATFDMFTLAGSFEATSASEWGVGASASATVSDGVSVNLAGRYFTDGTDYVSQVEAGVSAAVTEAITLSGAVGGYAGTGGSITSDYYAIGKVTFNPGGGFTSSASLEGHATGGYKAVFTASKSIK